MTQFFEHLSHLAAEYESLQMQNETLRAAISHHETEQKETPGASDLCEADHAATQGWSEATAFTVSQHHEDVEPKSRPTDTVALPLPEHTLVAEPIFGVMAQDPVSQIQIVPVHSNISPAAPAHDIPAGPAHSKRLSAGAPPIIIGGCFPSSSSSSSSGVAPMFQGGAHANSNRLSARPNRLSAAAATDAVSRMTTMSVATAVHSPVGQHRGSLTKIDEASYKVRTRKHNLGHMKEKMKQTLLKESAANKDVKSFYKEEGIFQAMARHWVFDNISMMVIAFNSLWMSLDIDFNSEDAVLDAHPIFAIMEQVFCLYFVVELLIRFGAFKKKRDIVQDPWFFFDLILVLLLVAEAWVVKLVLFASDADMSSGSNSNATIFRLVRVVRLTRLLRMAKLMQRVPELMIMLKALAAAARTVSLTLVLLAVILYVAALGFRSTLRGTPLGATHFSSVPRAAHRLFLSGAILEDTPELMEQLLAESPLAFAMMYLVIITCGVAVMNMNIGILCEVVNAVASAEHEAVHIMFVKETLAACLDESGGSEENQDGYIDQKQFLRMLRNQPFVVALKQIGIDVLGLVAFQEIIFEEAEETESGIKKLALPDFMEQLLLFRGSNPATVKDLMSLRKLISKSFRHSVAAMTGQRPRDSRFDRFSSWPNRNASGAFGTFRPPSLSEQPVEMLPGSNSSQFDGSAEKHSEMFAFSHAPRPSGTSLPGTLEIEPASDSDD